MCRMEVVAQLRLADDRPVMRREQQAKASDHSVEAREPPPSTGTLGWLEHAINAYNAPVVHTWLANI